MREGKLSVVMTFKNEYDEVAKTCKSIRDTAGDKVDIIALNDDSDKGFDYEESLRPYNVKYFYSPKRLGSSLGKQMCVDMCETPYFLVLDAHCRMWTPDWYDKAIEIMEKDEDCVYCCAVLYFSNEEDHQSPKHMKAFGGFWDYNPKSILSVGWNLRNFTVKEEGNPPFEIPCILGANYLCSKRWWDYLGGYNGLMLYGREETFISKKSWMAGGKVKCIPSILTGHKTRKGNRQPYLCCAYEVIHNEMVNGFILFDTKTFERLDKMWSNIHHPAIYREAKNLFLSHLEDLKTLRDDFQKKVVFTHDELDAFNAEFLKKTGFNYKRLWKQILGTYTKFGEKTYKPIPVG